MKVFAFIKFIAKVNSDYFMKIKHKQYQLPNKKVSFRLCLPFLILSFLFSFKTTSYCQEVSNVVDLELPDKQRLEWNTHKSINILRQDKNLPDLIWDDVLYRAAKDHADYLIQSKSLSHNQKQKEKRTPFQRVKIHGGLGYSIVGENIVLVTLGTQFLEKGRMTNTLTYESTGKTLGLLWKSSPEHYKNIISQEYNNTAIAVSYDSISQQLIAVQVFGYSNTTLSDIEIPDYSNYLLKLSKPKLPYGLKEYSYNKKDKSSINGFHKLDIHQGHLTGHIKSAKKIFKGRRSGICQEFIPISDYDSNSVNYSMTPNRRNGMFELNGIVSKPIYRKELLKYSRKNGRREYYIYNKWIRIKKPTKEFLYPLKSNSSEEEYILFLIKSKQLVTNRTYMMVPSQFFTVPFPNLDFVADFKTIDTKPIVKLNSRYDTLYLKVFYPVSVTEITNNRQEEIISELDSIKGEIVDIKALAYSSIEGNLEMNNEIAKERMSKFIELVKPKLNKYNFEYQTITGEQWDLFNRQIKNTTLSHLSKLSKEEIRSYINANRNDSLIAKLLEEQRYTKFTIICRQDFKDTIISTQTPTEKYDSLTNLIKNTDKPKSSFLRSVEQAQLAYYHSLVNIDTIFPYSIIQFPNLEKHPEFAYHDLVFRFIVLKELSDEEFFYTLHTIGFSKHFPRRLMDKLVYNNLLLIYNNYLLGRLRYLIDNVSCFQIRQRDFYFRNFKEIYCPLTNYYNDNIVLEELPNFIRIQKKIDQDKFTNELWQYYYLNMVISLSKQIPYNTDINRYLRGFKKYFHPDDSKLSDEERLKYAYFYNALKKYKIAKSLIEPIAVRDNPHIEGLKMYVTLKFEDFENEHDFADYLITQFPRLGVTEWCDLWENPQYLNALLLEDLKLKRFYNCNCNR